MSEIPHSFKKPTLLFLGAPGSGKGTLKENRIDDASDKVIDRRIAAYEAETKPILAYYAANRISVIDATQPPVKVFAEIVQRVITLPVYDRMNDQVI